MSNELKWEEPRKEQLNRYDFVEEAKKSLFLTCKTIITMMEGTQEIYFGNCEILHYAEPELQKWLDQYMKEDSYKNWTQKKEVNQD